MIISIDSSIQQNPTSINDENSQQTRNTRKFFQPDEKHLQKKTTVMLDGGKLTVLPLIDRKDVHFNHSFSAGQ